MALTPEERQFYLQQLEKLNRATDRIDEMIATLKDRRAHCAALVQHTQTKLREGLVQ